MMIMSISTIIPTPNTSSVPVSGYSVIDGNPVVVLIVPVVVIPVVVVGIHGFSSSG
jgi:hypothetical protein